MLQLLDQIMPKIKENIILELLDKLHQDIAVIVSTTDYEYCYLSQLLMISSADTLINYIMKQFPANNIMRESYSLIVYVRERGREKGREGWK